MPALTSLPKITYAEVTRSPDEPTKGFLRVRTTAYYGAQKLTMEQHWAEVPLPLPTDWWTTAGDPDIESSWTDEGWTLPV